MIVLFLEYIRCVKQMQFNSDERMTIDAYCQYNKLNYRISC